MGLHELMSALAAGAAIALLDLTLSGDNALVIGAAASKLPRRQRHLAIALGGLGAVILRLLLAIGATELLQVPLIRALGGVVLLVIAVRVTLPENEARRFARTATPRLGPAIATILLADVTMSLDNVLAVGALAAGRVWLLIGGLLVSVALLFVASALVAAVVERFPLLLDLAGAVIAWTAASLIFDDPLARQVIVRVIPLTPLVTFYLLVSVTLLFFIVDVLLRLFRPLRQTPARTVATRRRQRAGSASAPAMTPSAQMQSSQPSGPLTS